MKENASIARQLIWTTLDEAYSEAERLVAVPARSPDTTFSLPQILVHCAQSIEFSMTGFPEQKCALFQNTIGKIAFKVFSWRGRMSHNLAEPIPGAPSLENHIDVHQSLARLRLAIENFRNFNGVLQPHFAYGKLDKAAYEHANAMHMANHFSVIQA